jgi:predicted metal-binding membrane protein
MVDMHVAAFVGMWAWMMAAMMVPSMAPFARRYLRALPGAGPGVVRGGLFVGGYLVVWSGTSLIAYPLVLGLDAVAMRGDVTAGLVAALVLATGAAYYLTPAKYRLLRACRSPFGLTLKYAGYRGRLRDLRAGVHHGATCLGCCWALMALLLVFGWMNVATMVAIALVVAVEKLWRHGEAFARGVGGATAVLAVAVLVRPDLAAGLVPAPM